MTRARSAVRSAAQALPTSGAETLPRWATTPITDEHLALINAFAAASTWPAQQAALREHHTTLTAPGFSAALAALTDLYPANPVPGQLLTLLDEITQTSMDATIGRRQADHDRRALLEAWISTPTWAESRTFLIDHREALLADDMAELLASADHDTARQHLAILNLAAALPTEAVYGIITNPGTPKTPSLTPSKPATSHNSCRSSPPPGPASPNDP